MKPLDAQAFQGPFLLRRGLSVPIIASHRRRPAVKHIETVMAKHTTIKAKMARLQAQLDALRREETSIFMQETLDQLEAHGLTIEDLRQFQRTSTASRAARQRDGATSAPAAPSLPTAAGTQLSAPMASGASLEAQTPSRVGKQTGEGRKKAPRAKYRNPDNGAIWSGYGRMPAWLKDAPDPSRFLFESREQPATTQSAVPAKRPILRAKSRSPQPMAAASAPLTTAGRHPVKQGTPLGQAASEPVMAIPVKTPINRTRRNAGGASPSSVPGAAHAHQAEGGETAPGDRANKAS